MIYWNLFSAFAKIGAFTFGGGYAMVSLIGHELTKRGWLSSTEFADIVAVSQMTPGPLALNVATFVGQRVAGIPGAIVASFALIVPALFVVTAALILVENGKRWSWAHGATKGIRFAAIGLIATSALFFFESSILQGIPEGPLMEAELPVTIQFSPLAALTFSLTLLLSFRWKMKPLAIIGICAGIGLISALIPQIMHL